MSIMADNFYNRYSNYVCIMKDAGNEVKISDLEATAAKTLAEYKKLCESKYREDGKPPVTRLIERNKWINPDNLKSCYIVPEGGKAEDINETNKKYFTTTECNENPNTTVFKENIAKINNINEAIYPFPDQIESTQSLVMLFTFIFAIIVYLFWVVKYDIKRPYYLYDFITKSVLRRIVVTIVVTGFIFYIFCPYNVCFLPMFASKFRKNPMEQIHNDYCEYKFGNTGITLGDKSPMGCKKGNSFCNRLPWLPMCKPPNSLYLDWVQEWDYNNTQVNLND